MKAFVILIALTGTTYSLINTEASNRGPAVEAIQEIDIESDAKTTENRGFPFQQNAKTSTKAKSRFPANERFDESQKTSYYVGPLLFLLALPLTFWIVFAKKLKSDDVETSKYFTKTIQFKPFETGYQKNDDDDDHHDENLPKAG